MPTDSACRSVAGGDGMEWNEMDEMSVEKWWNETCGKGENGKNPEKLLLRLRFVHPETHME